MIEFHKQPLMLIFNFPHPQTEIGASLIPISVLHHSFTVNDHSLIYEVKDFLDYLLHDFFAIE